MKKGNRSLALIAVMGIILAAVIMVMPEGDPGLGQTYGQTQGPEGEFPGNNPGGISTDNGIAQTTRLSPASEEMLWATMLSGHVQASNEIAIAEAIVGVRELRRIFNVLDVKQTNFDGDYRVPNPHQYFSEVGQDEINLSAEAPGKARMVYRVSIPPMSHATEQDFTLPEAQTVLGRVIWDTGEAIPDASVMGWTGEMQPHSDFSFSRTDTDGLGEFALDHIRADQNSCWIAVRPPTWERHVLVSSIPCDGLDNVIVMRAEKGSVSGRIIDHLTEAPFGNVEVWLGNDFEGWDLWTVNADENGEFVIPDVPMGHWTVRVPEFPDDSVEVHITPDNPHPEIEIRIGRHVPIDFLFVDVETNKPVPALRVTVEGSGGARHTGFTDTEGHLIFSTPLENGTDANLTLLSREWYFADGGKIFRKSLSDSHGEAQVHRILVRHGNPITFIAQRRGGLPVPGAELKILLREGDDSDFPEIGTTDDRGRLVAPIPNHPSPIQVFGFSQAADSLHLSAPFNPTEVEEVIVPELPLIGLEVKVIDSAERPVRDARVRVEILVPLVNLAMSDDVVEERRTDENGDVLFGSIPASRVRVSATAPATGEKTPAGASRSFDLREDTATRSVTIQIEQGLDFPIEGRVLESGSENAIANASVTWGTRDKNGVRRPGGVVQTNATGDFSLVTDTEQYWLDLTVGAEGYSSTDTEHWLFDLPKPNVYLDALTNVHGHLLPPLEGQDQIWFTLWRLVDYDYLEDEEPITMWDLWDVAHGPEVMGPDNVFRWYIDHTELADDNMLMVFQGSTHLQRFTFERPPGAQGREIEMGAFTFEEGFPIRIRVRNIDDKNVGGATVQFERIGDDILPRNFAPKLSIRTGGNGIADMTPLPEGRWRVRIRHDDYFTLVEEITVPSEDPYLFRLTPIEGAPLTIIIKGPEGGPLQNAWVRVWDNADNTQTYDERDEWRWGDELNTGGNGRVVFEEVPLSSARVEIQRLERDTQIIHSFMIEKPKREEGEEEDPEWIEERDFTDWHEIWGTASRFRFPPPHERLVGSLVTFSSIVTDEARPFTQGSAYSIHTDMDGTPSEGAFNMYLPRGSYHVEVQTAPYGTIPYSPNGSPAQVTVPRGPGELPYYQMSFD